MNCPNCRHENPNDARFCAQCATPLAQPAPVVPAPQTSAAPAAQPAGKAPAAQPAGKSRTGLIVLGVIFGVLLLFAVGVYAAFHVVVSKVRTLAAGETQTTGQSSDSRATAAGTPQSARTTGNIIGSVLGTDAKGKADIGKALNAMSQAGQQIERHDKARGNTSGTPDAADTQQAMTAVGGLLSALGGSLGGATRHDPVDFHALEALLPSSLPGMERATPKGNADDVVGIKTASADVDFTGPNDARINVSIKDATALSGLAGLAEMANAGESEQGESYEKNETIAGRTVHEKWDAPSKHGELSLIVGKRFGVDVVGHDVSMDALKNALAQVDLGKLDAMKDVNRQAK